MLNYESTPLRADVYPGEFTPLFNEEDMKLLLGNKLKKEVCHPPVNMIELSKYFLLEVSIPGANREDFLVCVNGNILSIYVVHDDFNNKGIVNYAIHEFSNEYFDRHIVLPDYIQIEFITAEYRDGILKVSMPKSQEKSLGINFRVAVY